MYKIPQSETAEKNEMSRERTIVRTSVIGIIVNVLLASFKAVIGVVTGSIAIVMDAVNNVSDAGSSLITIVGTKLASKEADRRHPFGYGRIEYLSAMVIAIIILYAGITSVIESGKQVIHPETPEYDAVSLVIVALAAFAKVFLSRYVKKVGLDVHSDSLVNSADEAKMDSVVSFSTLAAAGIFLTTGVSMEAWLALVISLIIVKSGIGMLRDTISQILGEMNDPDLSLEIKKTVAGFEGVQGAYDLVLNNYGPDAWNGSIHVEVPDTFTAEEMDRLTRQIQETVYEKHGVLLTAVGIYSVNTKDKEVIEMRKRVRGIVLSHEHVKQMHGFYLDRKKKAMRFDIVVSFDADDRRKVYEEAVADVRKAFPEYELQAALDLDFAETVEKEKE